MKNFIISCFLLTLTAKAQLTLESVYPTPGRSFLTTIAPNQYKYFFFDFALSQFKLYNLNHSVYMTVNVPIPYNSSTDNYSIGFVSKSLFDCDSTNIEYAMMNLKTGAADLAPYFAVYRTNGTLFQKIDSVRYQNYGTGASQGTYYNLVPIINTPYGTKLLLSKPNGRAAIYSVCSLLPTNLLNNQTNPEELQLAYPNPTSNQINLPYKLSGNEQNGRLIIYNTMGQIIKEFDVDNSFNTIILNKNELPSGTYIYNIQCGGSVIKGDKFIITN